MIRKFFFHALVEFSWPANKWIKGNFKQVGFYRVHYDDDNWKALIKQLNDDHNVSSEFGMICTGSFNLYLMNLLIVLQFRSDAQALKYVNYCTSFCMPIIMIKLHHFAGYSYLTLKTITLVPAGYAYVATSACLCK